MKKPFIALSLAAIVATVNATPTTATAIGHISTTGILGSATWNGKQIIGMKFEMEIQFEASDFRSSFSCLGCWTGYAPNSYPTPTSLIIKLDDLTLIDTKSVHPIGFRLGVADYAGHKNYWNYFQAFAQIPGDPGYTSQAFFEIYSTEKFIVNDTPVNSLAESIFPVISTYGLIPPQSVVDLSFYFFNEATEDYYRIGGAGAVEEFRLTTSVPEAPSSALLICGLALFAIKRRGNLDLRWKSLL